MKKNLIKFVPALALLAFPSIALAANKTLRDVIAVVIDYLNIAVYLIIALAVVTFVWNVYRYFFTEKDKKEAGMYVLYSTIGFFVILSFWGLVAIISNSLKLPDNKLGWPFGGGGSNTSSPFTPPNSTNSGNPTFPNSTNSGNPTFPNSTNSQ